MDDGTNGPRGGGFVSPVQASAGTLAYASAAMVQIMRSYYPGAGGAKRSLPAKEDRAGAARLVARATRAVLVDLLIN